MHHLTHLIEIAALRAKGVKQTALARDLMELAGISGNYDPNDLDPAQERAGKLNDEWSKKYQGLLKARRGNE